MKKTTITLLTIIALGVLLIKCSKDKAPNVVCTSSSVTYTAKVKPILDDNCATSGCHDASTKRSGYDFSTYASSKAGINKGLCCINEDGCVLMPPGGKMADSLITIISSWSAGGQCE